MKCILRAHHILCMQGFRGKGYSPEFVTNMKRVIEHLSAHPDEEIRILAEPDYICMGCPRNADLTAMQEIHIGQEPCETGACEIEPDIAELDRAVAEALKLEVGQVYTYRQLKERIDTVLTLDRFKSICSTCQWFDLGYCEEGLFGKNKQQEEEA